MTKTEGIRKKLKPVIEKKRRDRINHNLDALRDLLFKNTADTRLQNPKLEKAEILDLAVQYIKKTTRKAETKLKSNQMDSKTPQNQPVLSVSAGPVYTNDFYRRFKSSELKETGFILSLPGQNYHQELLLHPESSLYSSKFLCHSTSPSSSSSSQYSSPPSSPNFTSISSSPSSSPPSCPPPDQSSPLITPHLPFFVPQPNLPHMTRDFTPPHSPVLAPRPEPFSLPNQSAWRPWS